MHVLRQPSGSSRKHLVMTHFDAYQDGALTEVETASYRQHLATCDECQAWADNQMRMSQQLRSKASPPAILSPAATARIQQKISSRMRRAMIMNNAKSFVGATAALAVLAVVVSFFVGQSKNLEPLETAEQVTPQLETVEGRLDEQLVEAVVADDAAAVERLLEAGANPDVVDSTGAPILNSAIFGVRISDSTEIVKLLLEHGADANALDGNGDALLPSAAQVGQIELVRLLLDAGADVDATRIFASDGGPEPVTALIMAATYGHSDIMELLLSHGADVHYAKPTSALHAAAWKNRADAVRLLAENGADLNQRGTWAGGETALHFAVRNGAAEAVQALLDAGAEVDVQTDLGRTPLMSILHWGAPRNQTVIVSLLLSGGADPNLQDAEGNTSLHYAATNLHAEAIPLLIEHGAALDLVNNNGDTPLDVAANDEIAEMLREAGAGQ